MRGYTKVTYWSPEDRAFLAEIPDLGIITHGATTAKALENLDKACDAYLEYLKAKALEKAETSAKRSKKKVSKKVKRK